MIASQLLADIYFQTPWFTIDMTTKELLAGLWVVAGLIVIEGLLSVDNVLGIAALANELPEEKQKKAIRLGLAGAYLFRLGALFIAAWLANSHWVRWAGAAYLVWLMCNHLSRHGEPDASGKVKKIRATFAGVLLQISLMDLSLSIDNVIAAVGLAGKDVNNEVIMWPIYTGVTFAIIALQLIAPHAVRLMKKYPVLEPTAFVLIGYVGLLLISEEIYDLIYDTHVVLPTYYKFGGILIIMVLALYYATGGKVYRMMRPVVAAVYPVMRVLSFQWLMPKRKDAEDVTIAGPSV
jgi:tellurite resistance protein TerC